MQKEMDADWGGLETLLAAAEFVESQEQRKTQKLIEICEEYPTSEKNFSTESAASSLALTPGINVTLLTTPSAKPLTATATTTTKIGVLGVAANETTGSGSAANAPSSRSVITSAAVVSALPSALTNGSSAAAAAAAAAAVVPSASAVLVHTTLPSFSPSPSLTFTFTTPSTANQTTSLLKPSPLPASAIRIPTITSPRHYHPPLVIQSPNTATISYSPPPSLPARTLPPPQQQQQHPQPLPPQSAPTISIIPNVPQRAYAADRVAAVAVAAPAPVTISMQETKRKLSNTGTREVHNKLEKNRRAHLKACFEALKSQVPAIQDEKKPSNLTILRTAIRYVQILRRRELELESELERQAKEKIEKQQRISTLKRELEAQWDHIDFSLLLPETMETVNVAENGADQHMIVEFKDCELVREEMAMAKDEMSVSDVDDLSSQVKSRAGTCYSSTSPTGSCSISPLHISPTTVVTTTVSDNLPPQIHIVEAPSVSLDKLPGATVVSPMQFFSTSTLRMITDPEQPIALVHHNTVGGGDKLSESATLPKMAVHAGNTFTILSDSFPKVNATTVSSVAANVNPTNATTKLSSNSAAQCATGGLTFAIESVKLGSFTSAAGPDGTALFTSRLSEPTVSVKPAATSFTSAAGPNAATLFASSIGERTVSVKPGAFTSAAGADAAALFASRIGEKNGNTVLATVPVHTNVGNLVNHHSLVVTQPSSGQMLISTTSPQSHSNIMPAPPPLLKTVSRLQPINGHQLVMKPATAAVVVVSSSAAAAASK